MKKLLAAAVVPIVAVLATGLVGVSLAMAEEEVSIEDVPAAVRATIEQHAGQGEIAEIERETEDGQVVYEAEVILDGQEVEFLVSATGEYLGAEEEDEDDEDDEEHEDEETVAWDELPQAVQDALAEALPHAEIGALTRETEHGYAFYEAEYEVDGVEHEVKVTEDGHIVAYEQPIPPSTLPAAVLARIQELFPDAEIEEAELAAVTFYEIELEAGGKEYEVKILANGHVLDDD